jgi:hypothetical protein
MRSLAHCKLTFAMDVKAVDIVGCSSGLGTRQCAVHEVEGELLAVNDVVVFRMEAVLDENGQAEATKN